MEVIDSAKEININKLKNMIDDKYDTRQYRTLRSCSVEDIKLNDKPNFNKKRQKVYDINEIINDAKNKRAFIEEAREKQKYIDFKERRNRHYDDEYDEVKQEEQELEELINTMVMPKENNEAEDELDLFSDLKGDENTVVTNPIETSFEVSGVITSTDVKKDFVKADKTFYTDSNMFTKNDFEDFSTLTREISRPSKLKKVVIIIPSLLILGFLAYYIITNFIIK